jgi:hypothetical protein
MCLRDAVIQGWHLLSPEEIKRCAQNVVVIELDGCHTVIRVIHAPEIEERAAYV